MCKEPIFSYKSADDATGFLLYRVYMRWQRELKHRLVQVNLTHTQYVVLANSYWLGMQSERVTQVDIAHSAQIDVMMVSNVLRTLERKGLLRRRPHPVDTRAKVVEISPEGVESLRNAVPIVENFDRAFFERTEDVEEFNRVLLKLLN